MDASQSKRLNQEGVTLVEVMIALVILLIVFMGLIQASILSINYNLHNEIRDEATRIASEYMSAARSTQVDTLTTTVCPTLTTTAGVTAIPIVHRGFRNLDQQFTVTRSGCFTDTNQNSAQVAIIVTYIYPEQPVADLADPTKRQTMTVNSIVRRQ